MQVMTVSVYSECINAFIGSFLDVFMHYFTRALGLLTLDSVGGKTKRKKDATIF